ncbi:Glypican-5 [Varanus komodoensis]|nr:Glypican-5 [Varanus komodoensis]
MRKVGLDESPVGIKIAWRNINNLRYADDTTLMAESEEELKSLLMRVSTFKHQEKKGFLEKGLSRRSQGAGGQVYMDVSAPSESNLQICQQRAPTCCTKKMEESYQAAVRRERMENIQTLNFELKYMIVGHITAFQGLPGLGSEKLVVTAEDSSYGAAQFQEFYSPL